MPISKSEQMFRIVLGSALVAITVGIVGELLRERWAATRVYSEDFSSSWYADDEWNMGAFVGITLVVFVIGVIVGIAIRDRK